MGSQVNDSVFDRTFPGIIMVVAYSQGQRDSGTVLDHNTIMVIKPKIDKIIRTSLSSNNKIKH